MQPGFLPNGWYGYWGQVISTSASALEAARLRFRPILMTSLAFILGVLPLAISTGAGAGARHSVGTGVMGGMMAATFLAIFFVPLFYKFITDRKLSESRSVAELREEIEHHHSTQHAAVHRPHSVPQSISQNPSDGGRDA